MRTNNGINRSNYPLAKVLITQDHAILIAWQIILSVAMDIKRGMYGIVPVGFINTSNHTEYINRKSTTTDNIKMLFSCTESENIAVCIIHLFTGIGVCIIHLFTGIATAGIVLLAAVWCGYFLSRVREIGRKIHYLKKQREERCYEELINAKVDYIKSIFIAAISASEALIYLSAIVVGYFHIFVRVHTHNCPFPIRYTNELHSFRVVVLLAVSSVITFLSLIHILTSYLSHAYAIKRVISLARRDKVMLAWLFIQLIVIWISIAYWRAFISIIIIIVICLFPIHLCLYIKYSRSLYLLLKWRRLDAWFEDPQSHKRLDGMCKEYKANSILYTLCVSILIASLSYVLILTAFETIVRRSCMEFVFYGINSSFIQGITSKLPLNTTNRVFYHLLTNILALIGTWVLLSVHLRILWRYVKQALKRRMMHRINIRDVQNGYQLVK